MRVTTLHPMQTPVVTRDAYFRNDSFYEDSDSDPKFDILLKKM